MRNIELFVIYHQLAEFRQLMGRASSEVSFATLTVAREKVLALLGGDYDSAVEAEHFAGDGCCSSPRWTNLIW